MLHKNVECRTNLEKQGVRVYTRILTSKKLDQKIRG